MQFQSYVLRSFRFRWAVCQLDSLEKCHSRAHVRQALRDPPTTLYETYDRILRAIPTRDAVIARRVLQWLAFPAPKILHSLELSVAIAFNMGQKVPFNEEDVIENPADLQIICCSLITTVERPRELCSKTEVIFVLAHYSVKEYLISEHIAKSFTAFAFDESSSRLYMAQVTVQCLLSLEGPASPLSRYFRGALLYPYSATFWISLVTTAGMSEDLEILVVTFLESSSYTMLMEHDASGALYPPFHCANCCRFGPDASRNSRFGPSSTGLLDVLESNYRPLSAIYLASANGWSRIVERLPWCLSPNGNGWSPYTQLPARATSKSSRCSPRSTAYQSIAKVDGIILPCRLHRWVNIPRSQRYCLAWVRIRTYMEERIILLYKQHRLPGVWTS